MKFTIQYSPLSSTQISKTIMNCSKFASKVNFCGVYAADTLPQVNVRKGVYIVNCDVSSQGGSHWICIYLKQDNTACFFDSYGVPPYEKHHLKFLTKNAGCKWTYNNIRLQSEESSVCGHYCCLFTYFVRRGKDSHNFGKILKSENYYENDAQAILLYGETFPCNKFLRARKHHTKIEDVVEQKHMCCFPRMRKTNGTTCLYIKMDMEHAQNNSDLRMRRISYKSS